MQKDSAPFTGLPKVTTGHRIGLLGGSFDPPHAGHVHITQQALKRFGLDRVWWLVSPGNPLKPNPPADIDLRIKASRDLISNQRVVVTDIETRLKTRYTADTLAELMKRYPGARFVWLMGADNLAGFHRWENWDWIMENVPVGVLSRPGAQVSAGLSPAARRYERFRVPEAGARRLPLMPAPAWSLVTGPTVRMSSTRLREKGGWPRASGQDLNE